MKDKGTYLLANVKQRSSDWFYMRKGRITGSILPKVVGHAPYCHQTYEEIAMCITGKMKEVFTKEAKERMSKGTHYEDYVRGYLEKELNVKFVEEGFCIWKKAPERFGCSNDGAMDDVTFLEIKCPAKMYRPIQDYIDNPNADPNSIDHIYKGHYDQMIMNGVVTNRKYAIFCVYAHEEKQIFYQRIKIDYDYWYNFLLPKANSFYDDYILPILDK